MYYDLYVYRYELFRNNSKCNKLTSNKKFKRNWGTKEMCATLTPPSQTSSGLPSITPFADYFEITRIEVTRSGKGCSFCNTIEKIRMISSAELRHVHIPPSDQLRLWSLTLCARRFESSSDLNLGGIHRCPAARTTRGLGNNDIQRPYESTTAEQT